MSSLSELLGGASGGGIAIDEPCQLNFEDDIYNAPDGTVWLRSGYVETDPSVYPDATPNAEGNVGIALAATNSDTGLPIYVRVA